MSQYEGERQGDKSGLLKLHAACSIRTTLALDMQIRGVDKEIYQAVRAQGGAHTRARYLEQLQL